MSKQNFAYQSLARVNSLEEEENNKLRMILEKYKFPSAHFKNLSYKNMHIWLSYSLIPEIILRNFNNLKRIDDLLLNYNMGLKEYWRIAE